MNESTFTSRQIRELRKIERARLKRGESGLQDEIQALIARFSSDLPKEPEPKKAKRKAPSKKAKSYGNGYVEGHRSIHGEFHMSNPFFSFGGPTNMG